MINQLGKEEERVGVGIVGKDLSIITN